jgi:hypothetical protein
VLWRRRIDVALRNFSDNQIDMDVKEADGFEWRFTGVYGFSQTEVKHKTYTLLKDLQLQYTINVWWLCAGDFNEIMYQHKKKGGAYDHRHRWIDLEKQLIFCELLELAFEGDIFTWCNQ